MTKEQIYNEIKDEDEVDIWIDDGDKIRTAAPSLEVAEWMLDNIEAGAHVEARVYYDDDGNKVPANEYDGTMDVETIFDSDDFIADEIADEEDDYEEPPVEPMNAETSKEAYRADIYAAIGKQLEEAHYDCVWEGGVIECKVNGLKIRIFPKRRTSDKLDSLLFNVWKGYQWLVINKEVEPEKAFDYFESLVK